MTVVPVAAVEMGPRNRRRLTTGGVTLGLVAAISLFGLWMFGGLPFGHSSNQSGPTAKPFHLTLVTDQLVYGMSEQQVKSRIGLPEKVAGGCLQYHEDAKTFVVGDTITAVRVCFLGNAYSNYYWQINGKWRDPGDTRKVIAPPTQ